MTDLFNKAPMLEASKVSVVRSIDECTDFNLNGLKVRYVSRVEMKRLEVDINVPEVTMFNLKYHVVMHFMAATRVIWSPAIKYFYSLDFMNNTILNSDNYNLIIPVAPEEGVFVAVSVVKIPNQIMSKPDRYKVSFYDEITQSEVNLCTLIHSKNIVRQIIQAYIGYMYGMNNHPDAHGANFLQIEEELKKPFRTEFGTYWYQLHCGHTLTKYSTMNMPTPTL